MKTSTVLIISTLVIIFISLIAFNFDLKASFLQGNYKNPYYGFHFSALKDIKEIDVQCANRTYIKIEHGTKEGIYIKDSYQEQVSWDVKGQVLKVDLSEKAKIDREYRLWNAVIIVVNQPIKVSTTALLSAKGENQFDAGGTTITGFKQASLDVMVNNLTNVSMENNELGQLHAVVGNENGSTQLKLAESNIIQTASFSVQASGVLELNNPTIVKTTYQLSKMAQVNLSGTVAQALIK